MLRKKFSLVFYQGGGGGVSEGSKKANCFLEKRIFQKLFGTSLGPPKHVLHLVWSVIYRWTKYQHRAKEGQYQRAKRIILDWDQV